MLKVIIQTVAVVCLSVNYLTACVGSLTPPKKPIETQALPIATTQEQMFDALKGSPHPKGAGYGTGNEGFMPTVKFKPNSADILPESYSTLDDVAEVLKDKRLSNVEVEIVGHTDKQGPAERNKALSKQRAESVKQHLEKQGVNGSRLSIEGCGEEKPIDNSDTPAAYETNRRVEIRKKGQDPICP